ncbi:MAG: SdpI family protein, partial [Lachnospiraceae bacterium]|nr:SdpI family protein [Lachnospiraceae bacterium]
MGFWIFMLLMNLLIPVTMIGFGYRFLKKPPKEMNSIYGYRTSMSMKNKDTWAFAHHYCGKLWYHWGMGLLPVTILAMCFLLGKDTDTVGNYGGVICFVQMIPLIGVICPTERELRKRFDADGRRKEG